MAVYKHGTYGLVNTTSGRAADDSQSAIVYVGTAPVHMVEGGAANVNVPIVINDINDARKYLGYSEDWASYTLCEPVYVHLMHKGIGPIVVINVLDPAEHKQSTGGTVSKTPENGKIVIPSAESIVLDSLAVGTKTKGTDYTVSYNIDKKVITISETSSGSLGTSALSITYDIIDPSAVDSSDVIGDTDDLGVNTGLYAIKSVYQDTGKIPAYLVAPGFSSSKNVHDKMAELTHKVNGHWDAYMFVDLPLLNGATPITLATAAQYKSTHGFDKENETVYFPLASGIDGRTYHLSVLAAANFQELLMEQDGIPRRTVSNTAADLIKNLYFGSGSENKSYDDTMINEYLNKNGIASAAFVGGRWAIWGAHSADYTFADGTPINVAETNRMMLYYISNDFQQRRVPDVDQTLTANDIRSIVAEEQAILDSLVGINALTYGEVRMNGNLEAMSDVMRGDYSFVFDVTTTPLAKSLTAIVNWTDEGFTTYFADITEV